MKYYITNITTAPYISVNIIIQPKEEKEVSKEIYNYLSNTFGDKGLFTFRVVTQKDVKEVETKEKVKIKKQRKRRIKKEDSKD